MKLTILKTCVFGLMLSAIAQNTVAEKFNLEARGVTYVVSGVDAIKKIIYFSGKEISYSDATKIYDANGNKVSAEELKSGYPMSFDFDSSKRYLNRPAATIIRIESARPLVIK